MPEPLSFLAATPEGERLGRLAAEAVALENVPVPLWFAPLMPVRWILGFLAGPHACVTGLIYALVSALVAGRMWPRCGGFRAAAAGLNTFLTLCGLYLGMGWLDTHLPAGTRWVVPAGAAFQLADLHVHTQGSSGFLRPDEAVRWHLRRGYRVVAVTDTNTVRSALEAARRVPEATVVVGEEYRGATHLLLLGIEEPLTPEQADVPEAIRRSPGVVLAAHAWTGQHTCEELADGGVDGFEAVNSTTLAPPELLELCRKRGLAVVGGLDFRAGLRPTTATVLPAAADSQEEVLEALRRGECAVLYRPDRARSPRFHLLEAWRETLQDRLEEGVAPSALGWGLWVVAIRWWRRRGLRLPGPVVSPGTALLVSLVVVTVTGGAGVWAMGWAWKGGWYPPLEAVLAWWCVACPAAWWVWRDPPLGPEPPSRR